jgi:Tyrosine phosphatase family
MHFRIESRLQACRKDRTGILVMLIKRVCGVSFDGILNEYMMSTETMALWGSKGPDLAPGLRTTAVLSVERAYMAEAVEHVKQKYGDVPAYLDTCGIGAEVRRAVRENLLLDPEAPDEEGSGE